MVVRFEVTPWRDVADLLQVRQDLYNRQDKVRRQIGVNTILAWRLRKQELPLLLDSTADIVDAILKDEQGEFGHNALRLVYGTAVARFITGFTDTQLDLRRSKPAFHFVTAPGASTLPSTSLPFPAFLLGVRHSVVHRQLPSLSELKIAAQHSLDWLWEWYWSQLDAAFLAAAVGTGGKAGLGMEGDAKRQVQAIFKNYVKARKTEIKSKSTKLKTMPDSPAAERAANHLHSLVGLASGPQDLALWFLIDEKTMLPADRKSGDSMSGAFLIWSPFLVKLSTSLPTFVDALVNRLLADLEAQTQDGKGNWSEEDGANKEAWCEWLVYILTSDTFATIQEGHQRTRLIESTLERCFLHPISWTLKVAEQLLTSAVVPNLQEWKLVLEAAKDEGMNCIIVEHSEHEEGPRLQGHALVELVKQEEEVSLSRDRSSGSRDYIGMWRRTPIGALPVHSGRDE